MIIELTGSTGSGKSTLALRLFSALKQVGESVVLISDLSTEPLNPRFIFDLKSQNWKTDFFVLPYFLLGVFKNFKFLILCLKGIVKNWVSAPDTILKLRLLIRRLGINQYLRSKKSRIFIIDEGVSHLVHNIWVNPQQEANLVSKVVFENLKGVDYLIVTEAPIETLRKNILERGDRSPRVKSDSEALLFVERAHETYSHLRRQLESDKSRCSFKLKFVNEGAPETSEIIKEVMELNC